MPQYMISIYQPDGEPPPPAFLEPVIRKLHAMNQELKAAGGWVFSRGLHAPSTATVVRLRDRAAMAGRRRAAEPRRLDHHHGPQSCDRSFAQGGVASRPARAGSTAARPRRTDR